MKCQTRLNAGPAIATIHPVEVRQAQRLALVLAVILYAITAQGQTLATVIAPANGATNVDPGAPISWNAVSGAQAYYVYVGSATGLSDVYNSGSINATLTSITPTGLKVNTAYHLRLWTQINGSWGSNYVDTVFTTGYGTAHLTSPLNGATNTDPFAPFAWNSVPTALSYALNIGSTAGAADIFSSGPTTATSLTVPSLQINTRYYATLFTQFSSGTLSASTSFTTGTGLAHLVTPANGAVNVNSGSTFTWNIVSNAQVYYLYIGSSVGAQDIYGSGAITNTSVVPANLLLNKLYYARLWTEKSNVWFYVDSTFTTGSGGGTITAAQLTSPANGAVNVDPSAPFAWTTVANAQSYTVWVGTSAGTSTVYNSGALTVTTQSVPGLQSNTTYYVRLFTQTSAGTAYSDSSFKTGLALAHLSYPAANATNVDPFQPFIWNSVPGAQGYYIWIGSTAGATDVSNSAVISPTITSRLVFGLLGGKTYYAEIWTLINNQWYSVSSTFSTATQPLPSDATAFRNTVQQQTGNVRLMTQGVTNNPIPGTLLAQIVAQEGGTTAFCGDYANALAQLLIGQRISVRVTTMAFDGTLYEQHITTEYWDPFLNQWITADPTFGVVYWNPSSTTGLSIANIVNDITSQNWSAIQPFILYTTSNGEIYSHNYYMEPILNYLNPLAPGQGVQLPLKNSPAPYFTVQANSVIGTAGTWVFSFVSQTDSLTISDPAKGTVTYGPLGGTIYSQAVVLSKGWSIVSSSQGRQILKINRYLYF